MLEASNHSGYTANCVLFVGAQKRLPPLSSAQANQLLRVFERLGRESLSGEHTANLARARIALQFFDRSNGAALRFALLYAVMMVGQTSELQQRKARANFAFPDTTALRVEKVL